MSDGYNPINAAMDHLGFGDPLQDVVRQGGLGFDPLKNVGMDMPPVGTDLFLDYGVKSWAQEMGPMTGTTPGAAAGQQGTGWAATGAGVTTAGGAWAALDVHNPEIASAANRFGVPANLLKSMINRESSGNWGSGGSVWVSDPNAAGGGFNILPFVGMKEATAQSLGLNYGSLIGNKQAQVDSMAQLMSNLAAQYGGYENAVKVYFGGEQALTAGGYTDVLGMNSGYYGQQAIEGWQYLDQLAGGTGGGTNYLTPSGDWGVSGQMSGNQVVQEALKYVNTPYVLGQAPGKGVTPTSWDCSGFTYWLDQNYGNGSLPQGSHEQYAYAVANNRLFTDPNQLQPGDLVFINTGFSYRGNAASHVAMYIGNGQMIHAANESVGTIISPISGYQNQMMGAMHQSWSGGAGATGGGQPSQQAPSYAMSPGAVMAALMSGQKVPGYG